MVRTDLCWVALVAVVLVLGGCTSDDEPEGGEGDGGNAGTSGGDPDGGSEDGGTPTGDSGAQAGSGGSGGSDAPDEDAGEAGSSADAGSAGSGGSGGSGAISGELAELCDDLVQLHDDKAEELSCSGNDSAAQRRLCEVSGSCITELRTHYTCKEAATTWSCDTTDGHPQTNASCEDTSMAFFDCLQPAIHEEDPFGCAALAVARNEVAEGLGCDADEMLEGTCNQLYLRDLCLAEWGDLVDCIEAAEADGNLECDGQNALSPTTNTCRTEQTAFETCTRG